MKRFQKPALWFGMISALILTTLQGGLSTNPRLADLTRSYDNTRIFELGVLAAGLLLLKCVRAPTRWPLVWGGLLTLGLLSAALSSHTGLSLKEVFLWVGLLILTTRLSALRPGALTGLGIFLITVQVVWTVDLIAFWTQHLLMGSSFDPQAFDLYRAAFTLFSHPRFLNQFQSWMLPVASLLCLRFKGHMALRLLCWGLLVVSWSQLWLSMGRGSMLGLASGALTVAFLLGRVGRRFAILQGILAFAGWSLYFLLFQRFLHSGALQTVADRPLTTTGRIPAWRRAWEMFLESPLLGSGPQSFAWEGVLFGHPHSGPLQVLAEWGGIAFFAAGLVLLWGIWSAGCLWRSKRLRLARRDWFVALTMSSVAAAVHSLVSGILVMPLSHLGFVVVLALWFRISGLQRLRACRIPGVVVAMILFLILGLGLLFPDRDLPWLGRTSMDLESSKVQRFTRPRFWGDGL